MTRLNKLGFLVALVVALTVAVQVNAAPIVKAPVVAMTPPTEPCDFQHRMDIAIVNGVWFECSCEALMVGTVCDWYEITSPAQDPRKRARKIKRIKGGLVFTPRVRPVIA